MSKKAASKGMQSSLQDKRFQKQSMQHVKGKITIDSPEVIIGYHDPVVNDMCVLLTNADSALPAFTTCLHTASIVPSAGSKAATTNHILVICYFTKLNDDAGHGRGWKRQGGYGIERIGPR